MILNLKNSSLLKNSHFFLIWKKTKTSSIMVSTQKKATISGPEHCPLSGMNLFEILPSNPSKSTPITMKLWRSVKNLTNLNFPLKTSTKIPYTYNPDSVRKMSIKSIVKPGKNFLKRLLRIWISSLAVRLNRLCISF